MSCDEPLDLASRLESRSPSMSSAGRGRACGVWYEDPLPSTPLLPPRYVTLPLYNCTTTHLESLSLLIPTRTSGLHQIPSVQYLNVASLYALVLTSVTTPFICIDTSLS
jgi:hypothetical protein